MKILNIIIVIIGFILTITTIAFLYTYLMPECISYGYVTKMCMKIWTGYNITWIIILLVLLGDTFKYLSTKTKK